MRFCHPLFLIAALAVPLLGLYWTFLRAGREKALARFSRHGLPRKPRFSSLQMPLVLVGLFLVMVAAARPQWGKDATASIKRSRNLVVALDVSNSMLAPDVRPNRLGRAKADIADLIDSLNDDRCALVAFRRTGVVICPLTSDHAFLRSALEKMDGDSATRGETDLGSAIRAALDALDPAADDHNAIIVVSDGGDLRGEALPAAQLAKQRGIPVFTVGIGDPAHDTPIPGVTYNQSPVGVRLEETALKAIAEASNGRYVPLATAGTAETTLGAIYRRFIRQVAEKEQREEDERAGERYLIFLLPGILALFAAAALSSGRLAQRQANKASL